MTLSNLYALYKQELISRSDSERELYYYDIAHIL